MAQSLLDLEEKVNQLKYLIQEKGDGLVQQIISSPHYLCLQTRFRGETQYLYVGRGGAYQGMDLSTLKLPASQRVQDKFLQYTRKHWRGMRLKSAQLPVKDRVLELSGTLGPHELKIWLFWQGRDLYFADRLIEGDQQRLFQSWVGKSKFATSLSLEAEDVFAGLDLRDLEEGQGRRTVLNIENYLKRDQGGKGKAALPSLNKKLHKKLKRMKQDLAKFDLLGFLERQTEKDLENIKKIGEGRFSVNFRGLEGHYKKREYLFNKVKRWKLSKKNLEKRIDELEALIEGDAKGIKKKTPLVKGKKIIQPVWKTQKGGPQIEIKATHIFFKYSDFSVFVGRNATESDRIRREIAKKDDLWLHLDGHKSGHMFVKGDREPNLEELTLLGSALASYSGLERGDIPIIFTQVKNLKGVKGVAGMVNYKKEKHLMVIYDPHWRQKVTAIADGLEG